MLSGWRPGEPLLDPMCGGATLLVEAAAMARGRAPGARRAFGFEKLAVFDPALWEKLNAKRKHPLSQISGFMAATPTRAPLRRRGAISLPPESSAGCNWSKPMSWSEARRRSPE